MPEHTSDETRPLGSPLHSTKGVSGTGIIELEARSGIQPSLPRPPPSSLLGILLSHTRSPLCIPSQRRTSLDTLQTEPGKAHGEKQWRRVSISEDLRGSSNFIYSKGSHACSTASRQSMEPRGSSTPTQDVHVAQMGR